MVPCLGTMPACGDGDDDERMFRLQVAQ
jgi:hypothetical protein